MELSMNNLLSEEEVEDLFPEEGAEEKSGEGQNPPKEKEENNNTITEVNPENLFEENPESVGNEDEEDTSQEDKGGSVASKSGEPSPKPSFYSSIATALKDEGILPDLDDETLKGVKTAEDFAQAIEKQVSLRLDERQRRIDEALNNGVAPSQIQEYEQTVSYLNSVTEEHLKDEGEEGENLRKTLIFQDFVNRGFSQERATREMEKSLKAGTDLEDAKEALNSNKEFFKKSYDQLIEQAKAKEEDKKKSIQVQSEAIKKEIMEGKDPFDGVKLDKATKQKVVDSLTKPVYKDEQGNYLTAIQKYEMEHRQEFMQKLGTIFVLTDGFKNLDGLVKGKVTKETKRSLAELERTLRSSHSFGGGEVAFVSGSMGEDTESRIGLGKLDI